MKTKKPRRLQIGDVVIINNFRFKVMAFDSDGRCISKYPDGAPYYFGDAEGELVQRAQQRLFSK